jgi:hypothetical protein
MKAGETSEKPDRCTDRTGELPLGLYGVVEQLNCGCGNAECGSKSEFLLSNLVYSIRNQQSAVRNHHRFQHSKGHSIPTFASKQGKYFKLLDYEFDLYNGLFLYLIVKWEVRRKRSIMRP